MITHRHLDEAAILLDCLANKAADAHAAGGNSPQFQRLMAAAERAQQRYDRRLERYRPLHNVACLLWHSFIGPIIYAVFYRWRKR